MNYIRSMFRVIVYMLLFMLVPIAYSNNFINVNLDTNRFEYSTEFEFDGYLSIENLGDHLTDVNFDLYLVYEGSDADLIKSFKINDFTSYDSFTLPLSFTTDVCSPFALLVDLSKTNVDFDGATNFTFELDYDFKVCNDKPNLFMIKDGINEISNVESISIEFDIIDDNFDYVSFKLFDFYDNLLMSKESFDDYIKEFKFDNLGTNIYYYEIHVIDIFEESFVYKSDVFEIDIDNPIVDFSTENIISDEMINVSNFDISLEVMDDNFDFINLLLYDQSLDLYLNMTSKTSSSSFRIDDIENGNYSVKGVAYDRAGNIGSSSIINFEVLVVNEVIDEEEISDDDNSDDLIIDDKTDDEKDEDNGDDESGNDIIEDNFLVDDVVTLESFNLINITFNDSNDHLNSNEIHFFNYDEEFSMLLYFDVPKNSRFDVDVDLFDNSFDINYDESQILSREHPLEIKITNFESIDSLTEIKVNVSNETHLFSRTFDLKYIVPFDLKSYKIYVDDKLFSKKIPSTLSVEKGSDIRIVQVFKRKLNNDYYDLKYFVESDDVDFVDMEYSEGDLTDSNEVELVTSFSIPKDIDSDRYEAELIYELEDEFDNLIEFRDLFKIKVGDLTHFVEIKDFTVDMDCSGEIVFNFKVENNGLVDENIKFELKSSNGDFSKTFDKKVDKNEYENIRKVYGYDSNLEKNSNFLLKIYYSDIEDYYAYRLDNRCMSDDIYLLSKNGETEKNNYDEYFYDDYEEEDSTSSYFNYENLFTVDQMLLIIGIVVLTNFILFLMFLMLFRK